MNKTRMTRFKVENYKRIELAEVTFDENDNLILITGKNDAGKSCFIEAIIALLEGKRSSTGNTIRDGEEKAVLEADIKDVLVAEGQIDDLYVKVTITPSGHKVVITNSSNLKYGSPQALLDALRGKMLNPWACSQMTPKELYDAMMELVDLDVDLDQLAEQRQQAYDRRTFINRDMKEIEGHIATLNETILPNDLPDEEVSASVLSQKMTEAMTLENRRGSLLNQRDGFVKAIAELKTEIDKKEDTLSSIRDQIAELPEPVNTEELDEQIKSVDKTNRLIRLRQEKIKATVKLSKKQFEGEQETKNIEKIDRTKKDALKRATFPVDGMSFDKGIVIYNGQPLLGGAGESGKLKVFIEIAKAFNPQLPFILIPSGSGIDSESMETIRAAAEESGYTIIIEQVDESGEVGIVFEDGNIVKDNR